MVYLLIRRWLPRGRLGGLVYGALLLVIAATRSDPLRAVNSDFDIVGPGWLAVTVFTGLVLLHGMLVAALAGRYSTVLPLLSRDRRPLAAHAPLVTLAPIGGVLPVLALVGVVAFGSSRLNGLMAFLRSPRASAIGRVVLAVAGLVALPGSASALIDIAGGWAVSGEARRGIDLRRSACRRRRSRGRSRSVSTLKRAGRRSLERHTTSATY